MSQLNCDEHLDSSGGNSAKINGVTPTIYNTAGKNLVFGGDFATNPWQRGTTFTNPANGTYTTDRFIIIRSDDAAVDIKKTAFTTDLTLSKGVNTEYCLHADVTTADSSISAAQFYAIAQYIEGLNIAPLGYGKSGTRYQVFAFLHQHTKTGTYCVAFRNGAANRSYVAEYTQDVSDAVELAIITVPVDTGGTWLYDEGAIGLRVTFALACGTDKQTTAGSWQTGNYIATSSQVNALDSTSNNFKIALIQLEPGQSQTIFESLPRGAVIRQCQRYYEKTFPISTPPSHGTSLGGGGEFRVNCNSQEPVVAWRFKVEKCQAPTCAIYGFTGRTAGQWTTGANDSANARVLWPNTSSVILDNSGIALSSGNWHCHAIADAELY
ncbi:MAG: hypothetical protein E6R03_00040 [Hyphomicrobiaceae bacterium]|nr:MAG: hypothetical protein E6R03_00040 [Hyphomicrobiaceae bacterium]